MTLVAGVEQRWEEAEFSALYSATAPAVRSFVRRRSGDVNLVEDLVQETFLRAYRSPPDPSRPPLPWLLAIARHVCIDAFRRERPCQPVPPGALPEGSTDVDDPHRWFAAGLQRRAIGDVLGAMPGRQRRVLVSKAVHGRSAAEIAAEEGVSVDGVKSLAARARRSFSDAYATAAEQRGLIVLPAIWWRLRARLRSSFGIDLAPGASIVGSSPGLFNAVAGLAIAVAFVIASDGAEEGGARTTAPPAAGPSASGDVAPVEIDKLPDLTAKPDVAEEDPSSPPSVDVPTPDPVATSSPIPAPPEPDPDDGGRVQVEAPVPDDSPADLAGQGTVTSEPGQTTVNAEVEDRIGDGGGTTSNVVELYCDQSIVAGAACGAIEVVPGSGSSS